MKPFWASHRFSGKIFKGGFLKLIAMSKIWIEILTPKQVMMFGRLARELEKEHELLITTREYKETNELLELKGISAEVVGKHGGGTLEGKLIASIERTEKLSQLVQAEKPNVLVSLASPEASRVAFGLKIPHVCINDIPEAEAVARLTAPLATLIVTPKLIPKEVWQKYGVQKERIVQYDALDPVAWLKGFKPNNEVLELLKIKKGKPTVTFRTEEIFAAYLANKVSGSSSLVLPIVNELMEKIDANFIVLPRYREQDETISQLLNGRAFIPHHAIDGPSLLHYSDIFIGSGGTMTLESALLGTPTISCRPFNTMYENYAVKKGLIIKADSTNATKKALGIIHKNSSYKKKLGKKAAQLVERMEDPIKVIKSVLQKFV